MMLKHAIAANSFEIVHEGGELPEWVPLVPAGEAVGRDGRKWINSAPENILAHFRQLGRDLPIDIEHSTEHKAPKGEPAPAVAWVKDLDERNGEIWGKVEWNAAGRQLVGGQEYRYLSPVILYQPKNGVIAGITSVAVTNQPNFRLPALNSEQQGESLPEEESMWKALLAALALPENATEQDAVAKVKSLQTDLSSALNRAESPSLDKFVPRADYEAAVSKANNAESELANIKKEKTEAAISAAIDKALEDGKITPATADYHKAQCRQDGGLERFAEYCKTAPVIADDSHLDGKTPDKGKKALNAEERKVCENLGISEEEYQKTAA